MINKQTGSCFCGNIGIELELTKETSQYNPRECDCDFCQKHGATYISENNGNLKIRINEKEKISRFKQGSNLAEFLICKNCGILAAGIYKEQNIIYAAINVRSLKNKKEFGQSVIVSPENLSGDDKIQRWKKIWFKNVEIVEI
jgi:hypothetical protein